MQLTVDELRSLCKEAYMDCLIWDKPQVEDGGAEGPNSAYMALGVLRMAVTLAWQFEIFQEDAEPAFVESLEESFKQAILEAEGV